jgi:uncharacterized RDD family membrane protein YckC
MMAVGLRVVPLTGERPSLRQSIGRLLIGLLPLPGLSLIWAARSLGGRPLQDHLTKTYVVQG